MNKILDEFERMSNAKKSIMANSDDTQAEKLVGLAEYVKNEFDNGVNKKGNQYVLEAIAFHPSTPAEALDKIADVSEAASKNVAGNRSASPETLDKLSESKNNNVVAYVANNRNTSAETLDRLADHKDDEIAERVAMNTNTSPATLEKLSTHENALVVAAAKGNPYYKTKTIESEKTIEPESKKFSGGRGR